MGFSRQEYCSGQPLFHSFDSHACYLSSIFKKWHFYRNIDDIWGYLLVWWGFPGDSEGKDSACQCRRLRFHPWVGKMPWRKQPIQYSCLGNPMFRRAGGLQSMRLQRAGHDWVTKYTHTVYNITCLYYIIIRGFPGGSDSKEFACNAGDLGSIPGLGRSPGEGNDNPLQYPSLENSMSRGAWQDTVHGVAESRTRL